MTFQSDKPLSRAARCLVIGQGISSLGSALTTFGLNVWIFRETGSYTAFALLTVLRSLPEVLFAPFAGVMADRFDKRRILLACDISGLAMLQARGALDVRAVAVANVVLSLGSVQRWASMSPAISTLVPREQLGRINGLQQSFAGIRVMLGPLLGALGIELIGLANLLALDALTYAVAIASVLSVVIPRRAGEPRGAPSFASFRTELAFGVRWIFQRVAFRRLLLFFMAINVGISIYTASFAPYVMSFAGSRALGAAVCMEGAGGFLTGLWMAKRRGSFDPQGGIIAGASGVGACLVLWGLTRQPAFLFAIAFALGALFSVIGACSQTLWQSHVPIEHQGKVFSVRMAVAYGLAPLSILLSAPIASSSLLAGLADAGPIAAIWGTSLPGALGVMVSGLGACILCCCVALLAAGGLRLGSLKASPTPSPAETEAA